MLKIKDNVDLKELEKFGFEYRYNKMYPQYVIKKLKYEINVGTQYDRTIGIKFNGNNGGCDKHFNRYATIEQIEGIIPLDLVEKVEG